VYSILLWLTLVRKLIIIRSAQKEGLAGWSPTPSNQNLKKNDFVDMIIPSSLHDLSFILNQPLKSADD
jgi:hypothetical protein